MKKINQIIFIFLLFILSFSQSFGSEVWTCTRVDHEVMYYGDEISCNQYKDTDLCYDTCKKIERSEVWACTGFNQELMYYGDENSCLQNGEANMCLPGSCVEIEENTNSGNGGGGEGGDGGENGGSEGGVVDIDLIQGGSEGEESSGYKLLAPIGGLSFVSYDPDSTEFVGGYLNKIFLLSIGIISVLAVVMLIIAGIQYMGQDSIFGKSEAKNQMTNAILGLLIAVGSFAILNTISPNLIGTELKIREVSVNLDESVHGDNPHSGKINSSGQRYFCGEETYIEGKEWGTVEEEKRVREELRNKGIFVKENDACTKIGQSNCTSVFGLDTSGVIKFKESCPACDVVITGGTECWLHSENTNHRPGNNIVDLKITETVKNFIEKRSKKIIYETWGKEMNVPVFVKEGVGTFVKELASPHYHVANWTGSN